MRKKKKSRPLTPGAKREVNQCHHKKRKRGGPPYGLAKEKTSLKEGKGGGSPMFCRENLAKT